MDFYEIENLTKHKTSFTVNESKTKSDIASSIQVELNHFNVFKEM